MPLIIQHITPVGLVYKKIKKSMGGLRILLPTNFFLIAFWLFIIFEIVRDMTSIDVIISNYITLPLCVFFIVYLVFGYYCMKRGFNSIIFKFITNFVFLLISLGFMTLIIVILFIYFQLPNSIIFINEFLQFYQQISREKLLVHLKAHCIEKNFILTDSQLIDIVDSLDNLIYENAVKKAEQLNIELLELKKMGWTEYICRIGNNIMSNNSGLVLIISGIAIALSTYAILKIANLDNAVLTICTTVDNLDNSLVDIRNTVDSLDNTVIDICDTVDSLEQFTELTLRNQNILRETVHATRGILNHEITQVRNQSDAYNYRFGDIQFVLREYQEYFLHLFNFTDRIGDVVVENDTNIIPVGFYEMSAQVSSGIDEVPALADKIDRLYFESPDLDLVSPEM